MAPRPAPTPIPADAPVLSPELDVSGTGTGELGLLPPGEVVVAAPGRPLFVEELVNTVPVDD